MKSRDLTIDLARGLIVVMMPATQATLYYGNLSLQEGLSGQLLHGVQEGTGAPLFMFLMGFSFFLGRRRSMTFVMKRSLSLLCLAYLLNFLKFVMPSLLGIVPSAFFSFCHFKSNFWGIVDLLMVGGIFQLAAMSYLVCGILYRLKANGIVMWGLAFLIAIISPVFWGVRMNNFLLDYLLKLFNGLPPAVFFPFFPWAGYSVLGLGFGWLYTQKPKEAFYRVCLTAGLAGLVIGIVGLQFEPAHLHLTFYRPSPSGTIMHMGLVLLWIRCCYFLSTKLEIKSKAAQMITWWSINITLIYICQGIIMTWLFPFFGFMDLALIETLVVSLGITVLTYLIVMGARYIKAKSVYRKNDRPSSSLG